MNNSKEKEIKKKHQKYAGKRRDREASSQVKRSDTSELGRIGTLEADIAALTASEVRAKPVAGSFWKDKLPQVDERDKLEIECPNYASIPVYNEGSAASESTEGKTEIVGVRFRAAGKVYYFLPYIPDDHGRINSKIIHTRSGDSVIVDTARGMEIGTVFVPNKFIEDEKLEPLKPMRSILRLATEEDLQISRENSEVEKQAEKIFIERVNAHGLPMKLIDIQYTFDRSKLLFYFSSEGRVDFRELVKELASIFHTRIELRQIGIRDEARIMGGLGACGRPLCCSSFLSDFVQVSIKMAKSQVMSLNPSKISGCCGRLMCCLRYENDTYDEEIAKTPPVESIVKTENGFGTVIEINPLAELVKVRMTEKCDTPVAFFHRDSVKTVDPKDPEYLAALERARSFALSLSAAQAERAERAQRAQAANYRAVTPQEKVAPHENMFSSASESSKASLQESEKVSDATASGASAEQKNAPSGEAKKKQGSNDRKRRGNRHGGHNGAERADKKESGAASQGSKPTQSAGSEKSAQSTPNAEKKDQAQRNGKQHKQSGGSRQGAQKPAEPTQSKPQGKGGSQNQRSGHNKRKGQGHQGADKNAKKPD